MDGAIEEIEIQLTPETYPYVKKQNPFITNKNYDDECKVKIKVIRIGVGNDHKTNTINE